MRAPREGQRPPKSAAAAATVAALAGSAGFRRRLCGRHPPAARGRRSFLASAASASVCDDAARGASDRCSIRTPASDGHQCDDEQASVRASRFATLGLRDTGRVVVRAPPCAWSAAVARFPRRSPDRAPRRARRHAELLAVANSTRNASPSRSTPLRSAAGIRRVCAETARCTPRLTAMLMPSGSMLRRPAPFHRKVLVGAVEERGQSARSRESDVKRMRHDSPPVCLIRLALTIVSGGILGKRERHDRIRFSPDLPSPPAEITTYWRPSGAQISHRASPCLPRAACISTVRGPSRHQTHGHRRPGSRQ